MASMEWKHIPGYEGVYAINNFGMVKSLPRQYVGKDGITYTIRGKMISQQYSKDGYLKIRLLKDSKGHSYSVHRLVALTFIENPENKETVNHIDGKKDNNSVENLEWASRSEQTVHAYSKGLKSRSDVTGRRNGRAKLDEDKVKEIRKMRDDGVTLVELARIFGIGLTALGDAISGRTWSHVE